MIANNYPPSIGNIMMSRAYQVITDISFIHYTIYFTLPLQANLRGLYIGAADANLRGFPRPQAPG